MALTPGKKSLVEHLVTPVHQRRYKTLEELAQQIGVTRRTLQDWKKTPDVKEAIMAAAYEWSNAELPKVVQALFTYAQLPSGDKDRMTIVRYYIPAQVKASEVYQDKLLTAGDARPGADAETFRRIFDKLTDNEHRQVIKDIWLEMKQEDQDTPQDGPAYVDVRLEDDDIIDLPQTPQQIPGRPRGSRKVRLKRQAGQE